MGYTHYFNSDRAFTTEEWQELTISARKVLRVAQEDEGIALSEDYDLNRTPVISAAEIRFNGYAEEGHETFLLPSGAHREFCKTARKPYDAAVVAVLMEADRICPAFSWASDGEGEPDYKDGAEALLRAA